MDPKSFAHLDPKLKETYARVMGTNTTSGDAQQNATPSQTTTDPAVFSQTPSSPLAPNLEQQPLPETPTTEIPQQSQEVASPPNSSFFSNPSPAAPEVPQTSEASGFATPVEQPAPQQQMAYSPAPTAGYEAQTTATGEPFAQPLPSPASINQDAPHEASSLMRVLYIIGAVLFFAIYTVFWIKVFNLPFLF